MKYILTAALAASLLSGCVTAKKIKTDDLSAISSGKMGAIVVATKTKKLPCGIGYLTFENTETGQQVSQQFFGSNYAIKSDMRVMMVRPGIYRPVSGICHSEYQAGGYRYNDKHPLRGMGSALGVITVEAGELVYPGTITMTKYKSENDRSMVQYGVEDAAEYNRKKVTKRYPNLTNRFSSQIIASQNIANLIGKSTIYSQTSSK